MPSPDESHRPTAPSPARRDNAGPGGLDLVIGHRGAAAQAPENTLAGISKAAALGISRVEIDIQVTADGCPVVFHDLRLRRITGARGRLSETPLEKLRALDAGAWFGREFAGERIPTLEDALALIAGLGIEANLEIKAEAGGGLREALAVLELLRRLPAEAKPGMLVSSRRKAALAAFRDAAPEIPRALVMRRLRRDWRQRMEWLECRELHGNHHFLTRSAIREAARAGVETAAYTVDDPVRADRLLSWGVGAIISNAPHALLAALRGR